MTLATENFNRADNTQLTGLTTTTGGLTWAKLTNGIEGFDNFGVAVGAAANGTSNMGSTFGGGPYGGCVVDANLTGITMSMTYTKASAGSAPQKFGFLLRVDLVTPEYLRVGWNQATSKFEAIDVYSSSPHTAATAVSGTMTLSDVLSVDVSATTVHLKQNGTTVLTVTGIHNTTATKHGVYASDGSTQSFIARLSFDDWSIDSFTPPSPNVMPFRPLVDMAPVRRASIW